MQKKTKYLILEKNMCNIFTTWHTNDTFVDNVDDI